MRDLQPIAPEAALDLFLDQRRGEVSKETRRVTESRIRMFVEWCEENDLTNMNDVTGRDLNEFRVYRREEGDLKPVSLKTQLSSLRVFLGFCASIDAVPDGLRDKVLLPHIPEGEKSSRTNLDYERGEEILGYLAKYEYASREHVLFALYWRTGMRSGSIRALDLKDFDAEDRALEVRHRPGTEENTVLKNGERGERDVALSSELVQMLEDYISGPRLETTDDDGRSPLITTREGRPVTDTFRHIIYRYTRPCKVPGKPCPHDRDPDDCEAAGADVPSKCPSARSPHDLRSGAITAHLLEDVPVEIVSDRMDVSKDVLDQHYDRRSEREKMEQRRSYLNHGGSA